MLHVRCLSLHAWLGSPLDVGAAWLMLDIGVSGCAARTHRMRHTLALAQLSRPPDDSGACAPIRACARATLARPSAAGEPATCRVGYSVQSYACPRTDRCPPRGMRGAVQPATRHATAGAHDTTFHWHRAAHNVQAHARFVGAFGCGRIWALVPHRRRWVHCGATALPQLARRAPHALRRAACAGK